jgi:hypothetical protein
MPAPMEDARKRLVALAVLVAVAVPLVIVAASGGGGDQQLNGDVRVERAPQLPELVVYVTSDANQPERAGGRRRVTVECLGPGGRLLASQRETWPFTDTDQGTLDPHTHLAVDPARIGEVERCRVKGAEPPLEAPVL